MTLRPHVYAGVSVMHMHQVQKSNLSWYDMYMKSAEHQHCVALRRQGKTYSEILKIVPVAKSTLSVWLKDVGLAKSQRQAITKKRLEGAFRGAQARKRLRILNTISIKSVAREQVEKLSSRELWLLGTALYWAEGSKEKEYGPGLGLVFNNSDPAMIKFYLLWLERSLKIAQERISLTLYIHETKRQHLNDICGFWASYLDFQPSDIEGVYFKKSPIKTIRKNTGDLYRGTLRVRVRKSSELNRKVSGWIEGLVGA